MLTSDKFPNQTNINGGIKEYLRTKISMAK